MGEARPSEAIRATDLARSDSMLQGVLKLVVRSCGLVVAPGCTKKRRKVGKEGLEAAEKLDEDERKEAPKIEGG